MYHLLLLVIYLAFFSLGLPDALLGASWPAMRSSFEVSLSYAGIISLLVTVCIIISSLSASVIARKLGTPRLVVGSAMLSAAAMLGYAQADSLLELCLYSIPYGLAAGAIDTSLNNYASLHYSARHMSWLHGVWGLGASTSPLIMSLTLSLSGTWQSGYLTVGLLQLVLALALLLSMPLWKKSGQEQPSDPASAARDAAAAHEKESQGNLAALRTRGVLPVLMCFFAYGALEIAGGLWAASYLREVKQLSLVQASGYASLYFAGIVGGRFLNGVIAPYCSEKTQIYSGVGLMLLGALLLALPVDSLLLPIAGLLLVGIGGAPICPALFHAIPRYFGEQKSFAITGLQMAFSYIGASLMPPLMGVLAEFAGLAIYPYYLGFWAFFVLVMMMQLRRMSVVSHDA